MDSIELALGRADTHSREWQSQSFLSLRLFRRSGARPNRQANGTCSPKVLLHSLPRPAPAWVCLREACLEVRTESFQLPKTDSLSDSLHHVKVKVEVVVGVQDD